jgi:hypothetical protein
LKQVEREADHVVVGGDVLPGPMPRDCLERLKNLAVPATFILGNGEVAVLEVLAGRKPSAVPEPYHPVITWCAEQLDSDHESWIRSWPKTLEFSDTLFCHATPRNENEIFTRATPAEVLLPIFNPVSQPVVVCGHTHMQFDRMIGAKRVVNAGSVGMPFGKPGANWLMLRPEVQLRFTGYDLALAAKAVRATTYPRAEEFATRNVLEPPTEAQILQDFARAEIR